MIPASVSLPKRMKFKLIQPPGPVWQRLSIPIGMATVKNYINKHHDAVQIDLHITIRKFNQNRNKINPIINLNIFKDIKKIVKSLSKENKLFISEIRKIEKLIAIEKEEILCFSIHDYIQLLFALMLAKYIKRRYSNTIVFGGAYFLASDYRYIFKKFNFVDLICVGTIDNIYKKLIKSLKTNKRDLIIETNQPSQFILPDYNGLDLKEYKIRVVDKLQLTLPIQISQGCFNRCVFCNGFKGSRPCVFEVEEIIEGIRVLKKKHNTKYFHFTNQYANLSKKHLIELCYAIIKARLKIKWKSYYFVDAYDEEFLRLMKRAGCFHLNIGLESGSQRILKLMNKKICPKQVKETIRFCKQIGIQIVLNVIIGFPKESEEDFNKSLSFIKENATYIKTMYIGPFILKSGSDMFLNPEKYGITLSKQQDLINKISTMHNFSYQKKIDVKKREKNALKVYYKYILQRNFLLLRFIPFMVFHMLYYERYLFKNNFINFLFIIIQRKTNLKGMIKR